GGRSVLAAAAGSVAFSGWAPYYGRVIKIQHLNGFVTVYAHNSENLVQVGDQVGTGAVIATVGRSGRASGDHLHFEVRRDGMAFNPLYLLESRDNAPVLASIPGEPLEDEVDDEGREWGRGPRCGDSRLRGAAGDAHVEVAGRARRVRSAAGNGRAQSRDPVPLPEGHLPSQAAHRRGRAGLGPSHAERRHAS